MPRRSRSTGNGTAATIPKRLRRSSRSVDSRNGRNSSLANDITGRTNNVSDSDFVSHNRALHTLGSGEASELHVKQVDLLVKQNRSDHHTDDYEHDCLIVRRGQAFDLSITFEREYNAETDSIIVQFTTGSRPQESKGTVLRLKVAANDTKTSDVWHAVLTEQKSTSVNISVTASCEAIVGRYSLFVETLTMVDDDSFQSRQQFDDVSLIVIFNPWSQKDQVYMSKDDERNEYVMNESGRLYQGSARYVSGAAWNFGQFEDVCLDAALYLMDKAELAMTARSNPLHICRCLSAMSNSNDEDGGVLTGRWTDTYPKVSTAPWMWVGSASILEQFMSKKKAVRFGQCWVFSGIVTTLLRALGIPTRSVTNFESAHDNDASVTIDYHWDEDDKPISDMNDSVWNFHVWNESWFLRPDLPDGYDGWQALDSTPQEASEGVMRCGPAPVKAIKQGHVYLPHDAPFIFAEVNGDKVHWLVRKDGSMEVLSKERHAVGRKISTKAVGSNRRNDITDEYKYEEGSKEEIASVKRAFRYSSRGEHNIYDCADPDVKFILDTPDSLQIGHDFAFTIHLENMSEDERSVHCHVSAVVSFYTGIPSDEVATETVQRTLSAGDDTSFSLPIIFDDVRHLLKPEAMITVYLKGTVKETGRSYAKVESFPLIKPELTVQLSADKVTIGDEFDVIVSFTNPLPHQLTGGVFHFEASGIVKGLTVPYKKAIAAEEEVSHTVTLKPRRSGHKEVMVNFSANEMSGLSGSAEVYVSYNYG